MGAMSRERRLIAQVLDYTPTAHRAMDAFLVEFVAALAARGWRSALVVSGAPDPRFLERIAPYDVPLLVTPRTFATMTARHWLGVVRFLRPLRPFAIQSHYISPFHPWLHLTRLLVGARLVVTDRSSGQISEKTPVGEMMATLRGRLAGRLLDRVVAVSEFVAQRDIERAHLPSRKVVRVHNGVDLTRCRPRGNGRHPGPATRIGYAGQLRREKGVATLLEAFARLAAERPGVELRIAGDGPLRAELEDWCRERGLGGVTFLGQIEDVADLFATTDIVVVPSEWAEAFGFVVAEAMACGTAVVGAAVGAIPEVIGEGDEAGLLFQAGDAGALHERLRYLVDHPEARRALGRRARQRATTSFSLDRMVSEYVAVYER